MFYCYLMGDSSDSQIFHLLNNAYMTIGMSISLKFNFFIKSNYTTTQKFYEAQIRQYM